MEQLQSSFCDPACSDEVLIERLRSGEGEALPVLVTRYMRVAGWCAARYTGTGIEQEDLVQEGMIGLLQAIRRYEPEREVRFRTYAVRCISSRMISLVDAQFSNKSRPMHNYVSLSLQEQAEAEQLLSAGDAAYPGRVLEEREALAEREQQMAMLLSGLERNALKFYLSGHTYEEIAAFLNLSTKSVDNALQRVRRKLRSVFKTADL